jgi:hypothetical protein
MNANRLVRFFIVGMVLLLAISIGAYFLFRPSGKSMIDVPVGDDMATRINKGTTIYMNGIPDFVLKGTGSHTTDFSATVKVLDVLDTRTVKVEILSPVPFDQQPSNIAYVYLCQPLADKAEKLADGTIVYGGTEYPGIVVGQSYDVAGVLQKPWQDYPYVYIPEPTGFRQTSAETSLYSTNIQIFITAARSFAEQATAAGGHHLTSEPVVTVNSKQIQPGTMEITMFIKTMSVLDSGPLDDEPVIAGELQYLQDHGAELSAAARKAVEDDIAYWRGTITSAMNKPSESNWSVKITANVDSGGSVDGSSLQVYADEGPPRGSAFVPAAQYLKNMRSAWATVAQGYASAASIAAAVKAP